MFSTAKMAIAGGILVIVIGAFWYVSGLRADLERSQQNVDTLETAVNDQVRVIEQMQQDQKEITESREEIRELIDQQRRTIDDLRSRFNESADGSERDFGKLALSKPGLVENIIELTEEEKNAGSNSECDFDSLP
jgi:DNA anti-recombination protein RmuC